MFNKSIAFGLVAAGLMIVPTAAFADEQYQDNDQVTVQEGAAINHSSNAQHSESINIQKHTQNRRHDAGRHGYGRHGYGRDGKGRHGYGRGGYCRGAAQSAHSGQETIQNGAAVDGSVNVQESRTVNVQRGEVRGC